MKIPGSSSRSSSRTYRIFRREWPQPSKRALAWLMGVELLGLVPILVIFGISQPDLYRSDMWQIGFEHQLNSNPNRVLYAYANYQPLPKVAFVWTRTLTNFNVAISVISLFFLLSKLITFIMKLWYPAVAVFINCALVALYAVSTYGQVGPDYTDSRYPAPAAWYFRQGCGLAKRYGKFRSCQIAQASLFITLYMLVVYLLNLGFSLYAMWPNKINDVDEDCDDQDSFSSDTKGRSRSTTWEMQSIKSPTMSVRETPFTPRTQAFRTLDRQLPLRQQKFG